MQSRLFVLVLVLVSAGGGHSLRSVIPSSDDLICVNNLRNKSKQATRYEDHERQHEEEGNIYRQHGIHRSDIITQHYIDEYSDRFENVLNLDDSIDERLANIVHSIYSQGVMNLDYFKFDSGDQQVDAKNQKLVEGDKFDDVACGKHLDEMLRQLEELESMLEKERQQHQAKQHLRIDQKHIRLARALDAFGRYESGFMSGRTHSFGSYEQCLNTQLDLNHKDKQLSGSRFCWAKFDLHQHLDEALASTNRNYPLTAGICLPESCHTRSFKRHAKQIQRLVDSQFRLPKSIFVRENMQIESIFCTVDSNSQINIPTNGKLLLVLLFTWLMLALLATLKRRQIRLMEDSKLKSMLTCLDLKRSWLEFVAARSVAEPPMRRVDLDTLNPVRWAGCVFVIWGHALLVKIGHSMDQFKLPSQMEGRIFGGFVIVGTVVVDTFFAMTAMIMAFLIMKKANRALATGGKSTGEPSRRGLLSAVSQIVKTRYLRLFPMLILFYWFKRSVFIYLGSGPFWDFGFNRETYNGACHQESWLVPFTFTSAFLPLSKQCLMQSWSVSNDMFFVVLCTPIMLIMTRRPKLAALLAVVCCLASLAAFLRALAALDPLDAFVVRDLTAVGMGYLFARISHLYSYPIYRISSFAVGILAGYALYHYDKQEKLKQWPRWFTGPATSFSLTYIAGLFLVLSNGGLIKPLVDPYHRIVFPYFMTLGKVLWTAANCVVFLRMMTDWNQNFWMRASAGKFWQSMSKINYALLLLHFDLLIYDASATPQGTLNGLWTIFETFTMVYLICIPLSILVYVGLENPIDKLIGVITGNDKRKETTTTTTTTATATATTTKIQETKLKIS